MYSYMKFINSILGNTVVTESSERLKEALRLLRIYNNSNNSLPTLSLTLHEKINNQKIKFVYSRSSLPSVASGESL